MLAVIPFRKGSKRLPGKNFKDFGGEPLYLRTVKQAMRLSFVEMCVVSSDCEEQDLQLPTGVVFDRRSSELATDQTTSQELARGLWEKYGKNQEGLLWLQATSPLRSDADLYQARRLWEEHSHVISCARGIIQGKEAYQRYLQDGCLTSVPTQETVTLNGAIFMLIEQHLGCDDWITGSVPCFMPEERSVDIDTPEDWVLAQKRLEELV